MPICYLVGAGEVYGELTPDKDDMVIAADGGYAALCARGVRCDLLVGDLDSQNEAPVGVKTVRHRVEKDETDMYLAYLEGRARGYTEFRIYGGVGGRIDHTFANYCLLSQIADDGARAVLYDRDYFSYAIKNGSTRVVGKAGKTVSVFAFGAVARGVNLTGLYYPLTDGVLYPGVPLGVSNRLTDAAGEISVADGTLLIFQEI